MPMHTHIVFAVTFFFAADPEEVEKAISRAPAKEMFLGQGRRDLSMAGKGQGEGEVEAKAAMAQARGTLSYPHAHA